MYQWKATAHSLYEAEQGVNAMHVEGITWHAITLQADQFGATKKLLTEVFGLTPAIEEDGWTLFPMSNGTILDLYAPQAIPAYGFNEGGMVFGFRVEDIEAASEELAEAGCELLGEITRIEDMNYRYRHFKGPDGRVYGINEQKK
jgi:predicted enzyme related to lactoylglutathione lyase